MILLGFSNFVLIITSSSANGCIHKKSNIIHGSCICRIIFSLNDIWSWLEYISSSTSLYPSISRSSWFRGALSPSTICFIRASVVTIPSIALELLTDCTLAIFSSSVYMLLLLSLRVSDIALNAAFVAVRLTISAGNKP